MTKMRGRIVVIGLTGESITTWNKKEEKNIITDFYLFKIIELINWLSYFLKLDHNETRPPPKKSLRMKVFFLSFNWQTIKSVFFKPKLINKSSTLKINNTFKGTQVNVECSLHYEM